MSIIKNYKIIKYNKSKINFVNLLFKAFKKKKIEDIINMGNNDFIYEKLYKLNSSKEFQVFYKSLLKIIKKKLLIDKFYYQKIPSFRIHRPGQKSVNFHNDVMYGHGESVINAWITLTNTNINNTLFLVPDNHSSKIINKFNADNLSINELNDLSLKYAKPIITKSGEILLFNTKSIHGTMINNSKELRISFDFRLLPYNADSGTKILKEFYVPYFNKIFNKKEIGLYFYKKNSFLENLSHLDQRNLLQNYCKKNNFIVVYEETEIYKCNHYPNLEFLLKNMKIKIIVMTSILCLPNTKKIRNKLIQLSIKNKIEIHFVIENKILSNLSINKINKYYDNNLNNYNLIN